MHSMARCTVHVNMPGICCVCGAWGWRVRGLVASQEGGREEGASPAADSSTRQGGLFSSVVK